jgi:hypothetical protein
LHIIPLQNSAELNDVKYLKSHVQILTEKTEAKYKNRYQRGGSTRHFPSDVCAIYKMENDLNTMMHKKVLSDLQRMLITEINGCHTNQICKRHFKMWIRGRGKKMKNHPTCKLETSMGMYQPEQGC